MLFIGLAAKLLFGGSGKAPEPEEEDDPWAALYSKVKEGEAIAGGLGEKPTVTRSSPAGAKPAMKTRPGKVVQSENPMKTMSGTDEVCFGGT